MTIALTAVVLIAIMCAVIYVFLIMPRVADRADMDLLCTDYAHRGLHSARFPENSIPAFLSAARRGYGIELDVRMTKDKQVVVFHDASTKRMCGVDALVSEMTLAQIKQLRLRGTLYAIPTLHEVLEAVDGAAPLLIEIKSEGTHTELCQKVAQMLDLYAGAFAIQSFDPRVLGYFKRYRPRFARGQLVTKIKTVPEKKHPRLVAFALSGMLTNVISRPDFISVNGRHVRSLAFRICVLLFKCRGFVWTVRSHEQYEKMHRLGFYTIFEKIIPS